MDVFKAEFAVESHKELHPEWEPGKVGVEADSTVRDWLAGLFVNAFDIIGIFENSIGSIPKSFVGGGSGIIFN